MKQWILDECAMRHELELTVEQLEKANAACNDGASRIMELVRERDEARSRLDESMKASAELRAKGRAAWEVLERYLLETRSLDLNRMPGSDDMLIALTGIRFLPPNEADMEWARQQAEKLGAVAHASNSQCYVKGCPQCDPAVEKP